MYDIKEFFDSAIVFRTRKPADDKAVPGWQADKINAAIELLEIVAAMLEEGGELSAEGKASVVELVGRIGNLA